MVCPPKGVYRTTWPKTCDRSRSLRVLSFVNVAPLSIPLRFKPARSLSTRQSFDPLQRKLNVSASLWDLHLLFSRTIRTVALTRGAQLHRTGDCLDHGVAPSDTHSSHPLQEAPLMLPHLAPVIPLKDLAGTGGFARAMHQRVSHGQQNAHRRLPPGRNPGGCATR
jgi:hypothetical protein